MWRKRKIERREAVRSGRKKRGRESRQNSRELIARIRDLLRTQDCGHHEALASTRSSPSDPMVTIGMDEGVGRSSSSSAPFRPTHYSTIFSPSKWHDSRPRWKTRRSWKPSQWPGWSSFILCVLIGCISSAQAAFVNFENCLEQNIIQSNPLQLQFIPFFFSVHYDVSPGPNPLTMTVYGNVSGRATSDPYPPPNSPDWTNPNKTVGKIQDIDLSNHKYSTLFTKINVLSYSPYNNASEFCESVTQGECPLGPVFYVNGYVV